MRLICPAFVCILCACTALAAPPEPKIAGPTKGVPGDIVVLDASESVADHFDWSVDTSSVAVPTEESTAQLEQLAEAIRSAGGTVTFPQTDTRPTHLIVDDGRKLITASWLGTWRVNLAVGNAEGVRQLPWTIVISGHGPQPPPPNPPDPPVPPVPPTPTNLTEQIAAAVKSAGLTSDQDVVEFAALAAIYGQTIPKEITDGTLETPDAVLDRTKTLTGLTLARTMNKWKPAIVGIIERHLNTLNVETTSSPTVYIAPFSEVAAGITKGLK